MTQDHKFTDEDRAWLAGEAWYDKDSWLTPAELEDLATELFLAGPREAFVDGYRARKRGN